jgi:hypothetical protein
VSELTRSVSSKNNKDASRRTFMSDVKLSA